MDATEVNTFLALLSPPTGAEALGRFLNASAKALRLRSDAELAQEMNVAAPTLASWRRRGSVSANYSEWFQANLAPIALHRWRKAMPVGGDLPVAAVIELLRRTDGNPLGVENGASLVTAWALGGLVAIAEFLLTVDPGTVLRPDDEAIARIADLLEAYVAAQRAQSVRATGGSPTVLQ